LNLSGWLFLISLSLVLSLLSLSVWPTSEQRFRLASLGSIIDDLNGTCYCLLSSSNSANSFAVLVSTFIYWIAVIFLRSFSCSESCRNIALLSSAVSRSMFC
jgi:hypothetical protein